MGLRAKVQNGRLVLDEASELPEGTVLDLVIDDEGDDIDENERHALHEAIAKSVEQARRGEVSPARDVLDRLRARRSE